MQTQFAENKGIKIAYQTLGNPENETIIFISGLGSHLVYWTDELCQQFIDRGFHIIRFDNRDVGLSDKTEGTPPAAASLTMEDIAQAPYTLSDMAADTTAVLDAAGVSAAHVVGTSLGGMIAQTMAIEHPERVKTLTSIMSSPSARAITDSPADSEQEEARASSVTVDVNDPDTYVEQQIEGWRVTSGPHFDAAYMGDIIRRSFERCYHPSGWAYQIMAAIASGDRTEKLKRLQMPTLVIQGDVDPLFSVSDGEAIAAAVPNAKLLIINEMAHCILPPFWDQIADAIKELAHG